jgi:hypothetical protein
MKKIIAAIALAAVASSASAFFGGGDDNQSGYGTGSADGNSTLPDPVLNFYKHSIHQPAPTLSPHFSARTVCRFSAYPARPSSTSAKMSGDTKAVDVRSVKPLLRLTYG